MDHPASAFISNDIYNVTPADALSLCRSGDAFLVDVREPYLNAHKRFGVENVVYCPLSRIDEWSGSLPRSKYLLFIDSAGLRSGEAVRKLMQQDHTNVINVAGGLVEWERDGCPVFDDKNERLTGSCMCQLRPRERKKK